MKTRIIKILICLLIVVTGTGCKKDWLDKKPDSQLAIAESLEDFQLILDQRGSVNVSGYYSISGANDFYIPEVNLLALSADRTHLDNYTWAASGFVRNNDVNWDAFYTSIFKYNYILTALEKLSSDQKARPEYNYIKGSALFWRGHCYFDLVQSFCKPYNSSTAITDAGIPLRLEADITQKIGRGNVQQVYNQILDDLIGAASYLPDAKQAYKTRPAKVAAYSLLARVYLTTGDFENALKVAEASLLINNQLLDYNTLTVSATAVMSMPVFNLNPEVNYSTNVATSSTLGNGVIRVDPDLYNSYHTDDLRKSLFFRLRETNAYSFRGTYDGTSVDRYFTAPAVDEMYLTKAECLARKGSVTEALTALNTLLEKRWLKNKFVAFAAANANDALKLILKERRKELVYRSTQWMDLRRLSNEPEFATTVTRTAFGITYSLSPGSYLYAWPIPRNEVLYSGIVQNPRD